MDQKKRPVKRKYIAIFLAITVVLTAAFCLFRPAAEQDTPGAETAQNRESMLKTLAADAAKPVVKEIKLVLADIKDQNLESARTRITKLYGTIDTARKTLTRGMSLLGSASQLQKKMETAMKLLDTADMALTEIALPAIDLLEAYPLSELKVGDGFNVRLIGHYLDFAEEIMPKMKTVMKLANSVDLSSLDGGDELTEYLDLANGFIELYREEPEQFSLLKSMLGVEEDRLYVIAVQNSMEIRASGGFPGSMSTVRIEDGILTLGDFKSVTYVLSSYKPKSIQITKEERELFRYLSGIQTPRDADLCPDFERVGEIWAAGYEEMHHEPADGVISMTPHLVQRILKATGSEIELFDGLVLDGDNAMEILLHDIYYKYFGKEYVANRGTITDELFADAAKKTMQILTDNVSGTQLIKYLPIMKESFEDRTLMLWMKDEAEQEFIVQRGWSGGLNADPENPEIGIYFNGIFASKMGWYVLIDTVIGEPTKNEDGSCTYPVAVTFTNNITEEEIKSAGGYISGGLEGKIQAAAYFFAPAGGTVSDFEATNGQKIPVKTYNGMELGFMDAFTLKPNVPITITYLVTTAPGVDAPLGISRTPTVQ